VGYDEPPPRKHREECRMRLADYGGFEMFAMTPLETNTGYVRREVWKKRESPHITVVKGSIHDNPTLDKKTVELTSRRLSDLWRRRGEFGDFVDVGGLIYPDFERCVQEKPFDRRSSARWTSSSGSTRVSATPASSSRASTTRTSATSSTSCSCRTRRRRTTPQLYALCSPDGASTARSVQFVVDPAARSRGQTNAETVLVALTREGIYANPGQNDVQAGIGQGRIRMAHGRMKVSPDCRRT
jgi:hypothetical protein